MTQTPDFDLDAAHHFFAANCFNRTWDLIDRPQRSPEEEEQMLLLSLASLWHWTQRADATPQNYSIGYWQVARVYTLLGQVENARRYGLLCREAAQAEGVEPVYQGFAYEALARAEARAGNAAQGQAYLAEATRIAGQVSDAEDKEQLMKDLNTIIF
jgi:hypothetical protein